MSATIKTARIAGLLYLFITITGLFNLIYVPGKIVVKGNATETVKNILANQSLYQWDIFISVISVVTFMFLVLVLYRLFKDVNHSLAALMVILVLVQIPSSFVSQLLQLGALEIARGADYLSVFDKPQRDSLAMLLINVNSHSSVVSEMFWGLWLFPLGTLVYRSGFLPRFIGVWLLINGVAYVVLCTIGLLLPQYHPMATNFAYPALLGEPAFMLWLLIRGIKPKAVDYLE